MSITALRLQSNVYQILDTILETGTPVSQTTSPAAFTS